MQMYYIQAKVSLCRSFQIPTRFLFYVPVLWLLQHTFFHLINKKNLLHFLFSPNKFQKRSQHRECVSKGAADARTRRSLGHHLLHLLILRLLVLCAPADFETQISTGCTCTRRSKYLMHSLQQYVGIITVIIGTLENVVEHGIPYIIHSLRCVGICNIIYIFVDIFLPSKHYQSLAWLGLLK